MMVQALGLEETDPAGALAWYGAIVAEVTAITAGAAPDGSGREAFARLCSSRRACARPSTRRRRSSPPLRGRRRADPGAGRLERRGAPVRRHRDDGGDDRERVPAPALASRRSRRSSRPSRQLSAAAVEESLRLEPAAAVVDRYATRDTELAGVPLERGDLVTVSLAGANRDPAVFDDPDRFDVRRPTPASRLDSPTARTCASACTSPGSRRAIAARACPRTPAAARLDPAPPGRCTRSRLPQAGNASVLWDPAGSRWWVNRSR